MRGIKPLKIAVVIQPYEVCQTCRTWRPAKTGAGTSYRECDGCRRVSGKKE